MARHKDSIDMMIAGSGLSRQLAKRIAREFRGTHLADVWKVLNDSELVINTLVVDQIRAADCANTLNPAAAMTFTAAAIMAFRRMLIEELAAKGWVAS